jgi:hypothetical protein
VGRVARAVRDEEAVDLVVCEKVEDRLSRGIVRDDEDFAVAFREVAEDVGLGAAIERQDAKGAFALRGTQNCGWSPVAQGFFPGGAAGASNERHQVLSIHRRGCGGHRDELGVREIGPVGQDARHGPLGADFFSEGSGVDPGDAKDACAA